MIAICPTWSATLIKIGLISLIMQVGSVTILVLGIEVTIFLKTVMLLNLNLSRNKTRAETSMPQISIAALLVVNDLSKITFL